MIEQLEPPIETLPSPRESELEQAFNRIARAMLSDDIHAPVITSMRREKARVAVMLASDAAYRQTEMDRQAAELEVRADVFVNIGDAVVSPTPEWLAKHETRPVTVRADGYDKHVRKVQSVRVVRTSHPARAYTSDKITEQQYKACVWYYDRYEASGLDGSIKVSSYDPLIIQGIVGGGVVFSQKQMVALDDLRNARLLMPPSLIKFFDLVVIDLIAISRASRLAKCTRDPYEALRHCADRIADYVALSEEICRDD